MGPRPFRRPSDRWSQITSFEELVDSLMATTAIPIVFPHRGGRYDGGLTRNQPLSAALAFNVPNIYLIVPSLPGHFPLVGTVRLISSILAFLTSASLGHQLDVAEVENGVRKRAAATATKGTTREPFTLKIIRPTADLTSEFDMNLLSFGHANIERLIANGATEDALSIFSPAV